MTTLNVILKKFKLNKVPMYIQNCGSYLQSARFHAYNGEFRERGSAYGLVQGTNESYLYDVDDYAIPIDMFTQHRTFSEDDIKIFFRLAKDKMHITPSIGGVFLDIGANIGTTSVYVSKNIDKNIRIESFEPDKKNYHLLEVNVLLNGCENITTHNLAISNVKSSLIMEINSNNRGGTRIRLDHEAISNQSEIVPADLLDNVLEKLKIDIESIQYVWIDVEGHEAYAIDGMMRMLEKVRPCLFMEFTPLQYKNLDVSETEFKMLYKNISKVYKKMTVVYSSNKIIDRDINQLNKMFFKDNTQSNLFLYN